MAQMLTCVDIQEQSIDKNVCRNQNSIRYSVFKVYTAYVGTAIPF
jgi:hypothetical protein